MATSKRKPVETREKITALPYAARVRLITERLQDLRRPKAENLPKSKEVIKAENIAYEWEKKNTEHINAQFEAWRVKRNAIADAAALGDMAKAVELLQALDSERRNQDKPKSK